MNGDNILDNLFTTSEMDSQQGYMSDDIRIPAKCMNCKTSIICSVLPTFMNLSKINILVSITQCPFTNQLKNESRKNNKTS